MCMSQSPREEPQSFAQKLQLRVPSVESLLLRGASRAEGLFRSPSKESLNRSPSLNSLTPLGENEPLASPSATPAYDPPSDIESEAEETYGSPESLPALSKEQLIHRLHRVEKSLGNYRGKYSELVTTYRTVQRDKEKTQAILSQSQDKALRRIGELREELHMDQQAKKHLQEEFDAALEEKDQMITVLQTQVALMKKHLKGVPGGAVAPEVEHPLQAEDAPDSASAPQSPFKDAEGGTDPSKSMEVLQKRVTRQENLLQKCKELLRTHKERSAQLTSENDTLQEQLQERLQELEKTKDLHTTEKTKLITQLRDAKNLIEQLEQDKGMVIAETKRQMHETLEMKEEEIAQLRSRSKMAAAQREELQEQKEKSEKAGFEELEKALAMAQRAEEARRLLQLQLEEQVKEVVQAGEEERRSLQQELTRVKQEVVTIMKKSSEEKMAEMEKLHSEALASKEQELSARVNQAVERCQEELAQAAKELEQQSALALEDAELQKAAIETEAETNAKEILLELETTRTRILELESSLERYSQPGSVPSSDDLSTQMEELRRKHEEEVTALEEKHREELEKHKVELHQEALAQHNAAMEEFRAKHRTEVETILKEKEAQLQSHVEDMNQKTMEKLDVKQTELEALSSELQEVLRSKQVLEERLDAVETAGGSSRQELEQRLQEVLTKHSVDIEEIKLQHVQSLGGMEKTLKEELNKLMLLLKEKEKELEAHLVCEKRLNEESERESLQQKVQELEELEKQLQQAKKQLSEQDTSYTDELNTKQEEEKQLKKQLEDQKAAHEKLKSQEAKMEKFKTKNKEMQEKFKKKLQELEESSKKELAKKESELLQKEQQGKEKVLASQTSSEGLCSAMSQLEANHKEELEKMCEVHKQEKENLEHHWQGKLGQQEEEIQEKHTQILQEKVQELEEVTQQLGKTKEEKEQVVQEVKNMKEELVMRQTTVQKLQAELKEAAVKMESLSQSEAMFKEQVEVIERNLNTALNERNSFQDQVSKTEEKARETIKALSERFVDTETQLQALEASKGEEGEAINDRLEKEKKSAVEQADTLRNNLTEFKTKAESKFSQNHNTVKSLQTRLEDMEKQISEKNEALQRLTASIDNQSVSKSEMDQALSEKEQKHLQQTQEHQIRKQLTSQLEEKEKTMNDLQTQLEEAKIDEARKKQQVETLEEKENYLEEAMAKMTEEQEKRIEQVRSDERLEKESSLQSLKDIYEEKLSLLQKDISNQEEALAKLKEEQEKHIEQVQNKTALIEQQKTELASLEKQGMNAVEVVEHCTAEQTKSLTAGKETENHSLTQEYGDAESLSSLQNKLAEAAQEKQNLQKDLRSLRREHKQDLEYVKKELAQENEKKLKLELEDLEMKQNSSLKQLMREFNTQMALKEQEMTAALKETIGERESEFSDKPLHDKTLAGKAQSVEVELMDSHREETNQLQKVIAQKDDDLNRTVHRYEQVLQSREVEMGDRVWQVQKELEDLQARTHSGSGEATAASSLQMSVEELQAQLAEKTTLLSEARLKEQQFVDRIHSLEDKMRCVHKNSVLTHMGSTFKDPGHYRAESFSEPTEFEYLRKVLFEYMMGRETKTMAKVITSMLKFPQDQAQQVLEKEDTKAIPWLR
ncbi:unnamed protein product [Oncorhynchus mykiss]|uniref:GRIP domain-containing protein n=1 Tax=Oncorhynchus mykiss TaxID=8022 RepID=A0A060X7N9_ONCMY|nr:unnamed protein product [Oncorhynchus mykiss]